MKQTLIAGLTILLLFACKDEGVSPDGTPTGSFEEVIDAGGDFPPVTESNELVGTELDDEDRDGELWRCVTETYDASYAGGGDEGFPQFNPNASVVYPGNLLQGKTLQKATPSVIAVPRAGGTISIDINDGSPQSYFEVEEVTKSQIGQAANNIISGSTGVIPANMSFKYETVYSRQQLAFSLGIDYNTAFSSIEGELSFSSDKEYNRTIVTLNQSYYTLSFDLPTSYDALFADGVAPSDLAKYVQPDNPVTYISDVTYGRIFYLLVETTSSVEEMEAAVSASFSSVGGTGGGADAEVSMLSELSDMKIKFFALGGESIETARILSNPTDLEWLIERLAESTDIRAGRPLSYVVRSARTNEIVNVALNTRYDITRCEALNPNGPPPAFLQHWAGLKRTFGSIGAAFSIEGTTSFYLFNKEGDQFMISNPDGFEGPFPLSELGDGTCPFDGIGAAAYLENSSSAQTVQIFDKKGTSFTYLFLDTGRFLNVEGIADWGENDPQTNVTDCPFDVFGISALLSHHEVYNAQTGQTTDVRMAFENSSRMYAFYHREENGFSGKRHLDNYVLNEPFPFEGGVSAGAGFKINEDRYRIIFNEDGDRYVIAVDDWNDYYLGPFGL